MLSPTLRRLPLAVVGLTALAVPTVAAIAPLATRPLVDETEAPPARLQFTLGDRTQEIRAGEPFEFTVGEQTLTATVAELPTRVLTAGGYTFEYPTDWTFEYIGFFATKYWYVEGPRVIVRLEDYGEPTTLDVMIEEEGGGSDALGEVSHGKATVTLAGREIEGVSVVIDMGMMASVTELYPLEEGDTCRYWIAISDTRDSVDRPSEEFREFKELLERTFSQVL